MDTEVNALEPAAARPEAPALEKGLDLLEALDATATGLTQAELARQVGRSVGEIFRMLATLERRGYVTRDGRSGEYSLSLRLFQLAAQHPPAVVRTTGLVAGRHERPVVLVDARHDDGTGAIDRGAVVLELGCADPGHTLLHVERGALDLLGILTALQNNLAGRVLHADLDLHGFNPPTVSEVRDLPRRTPHTLAR